MRNRRFLTAVAGRRRRSGSGAPPPDLLLLSGTSGVNARGAVLLNGTTQHLSTGADPGLPAIGNFFIGGWVRREGAGILTIAAKQPDPTGREWILLYDTTATFGSSNRFQFRMGGTVSPPNVVANNFGAWGIGDWAFVLAWRDAAANRIGIRINATAANEVTTTGGITPTTAPMILGASQASAAPTFDRYFNGRLDQFAFGNPANIGAIIGDIHAGLFNNGAGVSYDQITPSQRSAWGLISFWELDELSGNRRDSHGPHELAAIGSPGPEDGVASGPADDLDPAHSWVSSAGIPPTFIQNTVAFRPTFRSSGFLSFDGLDDRLDRAGPTISDRPQFSATARIRIDSTPANSAPIYSESDAAGNVVFRLGIDASRRVIAAYQPVGGTLATVMGTAPVPLNTDARIAAVRDGTTLRIFLDGAEAGPPATISAGSDMTGATSRIGGPVGAGFSHFAGRVYEIRGFGSALTPQEISSI